LQIFAPSASFRNPKIDYFLRFSTQIFTDFWPQATPSIGRSVRLRETMKARYMTKAKNIYRKSAQIRAIRGEPPTQNSHL
jgi:hypothetical protein